MDNTTPYVAIVDDDASVCRAIRRLLFSVGIESESFLSGDEFLRVWSETLDRKPGCIILDIHMPGTNGLDVQRQLSGCGVPVIVVTAFDEIGLRQQALASGAAGYLRKPITDSILISTVKAALDNASPSDSSGFDSPA